ncbi:MAG: hypothetical protein ACLQJR_06230 [Stellaceae bacterium]
MASMMGPTGEQRIVTKKDIDEIVGRLDDAATAAIIATGASRDELLEAYAWLTADDAQRHRLHRAPHGMIARLCDLLEAEIAPPEER